MVARCRLYNSDTCSVPVVSVENFSKPDYVTSYQTRKCLKYCSSWTVLRHECLHNVINAYRCGKFPTEGEDTSLLAPYLQVLQFCEPQAMSSLKHSGSSLLFRRLVCTPSSLSVHVHILLSFRKVDVSCLVFCASAYFSFKFCLQNNQGWSLFLLDQLLTQSNNAAAEFIEEVLHQLSPFSLDEKLKSCYKPQLEEAVSLAKLYYNLHEKNSKPHCQKQLVNNNGLEGKDLEFSPKLSFTGNLPCVPTSRLS